MSVDNHGHLHILTAEQFRALARPTSTHLETDIVDAYINECEDVYIIPAIGTTLFGELAIYVEARQNANEQNPVDENPTNEALLNGTDYEPTDGCGCPADGMRLCYGLRKALSYFTYGKMMLDDGLTLTRSGNIQHLDEYGARMAQQQRINRYNDVINTAKMYLDSVLQFIKSEVNPCQPKIKQNNTRIKAIGD